MAKTIHNRVDVFLEGSRQLIEGARVKGPASERLGAHGYPAQELERGKALYDQALALRAVQTKEYGDQFQATEALDAAWTEADVGYARSVKLARVAFRDDVQALASLRLTGPRPTTLSAWLEQATVFYHNLLANPGWVKALAALGRTQEVLVAEQVLVQGVADQKTTQRTQAGEAQEATDRRDAALAALERWVQDFRAVAKVALADRPQLLEGLGIRG